MTPHRRYRAVTSGAKPPVSGGWGGTNLLCLEGIKAAPRCGNTPRPAHRSSPEESDQVDLSQSSREGGPTSVYRYFDKHGVLLYVGITGRGLARNGEHDKTKEWWGYVTRQEVDHYRTRRAAHNIEKELIRQHRPPFNVQHNPGHAETREAYLTFTNGNLPMGADQLMARALGTPHRIYLDTVAVVGDVVVLASSARDEAKVRALSMDASRIDIASGGRRAKLAGIALIGGHLRLEIRVADAALCGGAELMIRFAGARGERPTIKRVDLYMPAKGGRNSGRKRSNNRSAA